ncbi:N(6)-adenine-specific methyltransferase METTL4-like [Argopecten irradians]|uniref:N(6)-adenine-specific methyltransferase METTL4-like n=1 Tax=Argopecten irradians TaxID=31199 RepID=UPI0037125FB5
MAVICKSVFGWILDHKQYLDQIYCRDNSVPSERNLKSFQFKADLFHIISPFMMDSQFAATRERASDEGHSSCQRKRKKKRKAEFNFGELKAVEYHNQIKDQLLSALSALIELGKETGYFSIVKDVKDTDNNMKARLSMKAVEQCDDPLQESCYQDNSPTISHCQGITLHNNDSVKRSSIVNRPVRYHDDDPAIFSLYGDDPTVASQADDMYLLPPRCSFLMSDLSHVSLLESSTEFHKFDMIVMDPPWQNKSVKRLKKYSSMSNDDLLDIPIQRLGADNSVVVVWVTNRWQHIQFIKDTLFPRWSVQFVAEWHWVKVTKSGEMVYAFDSPHRKPYEVLIIGRLVNSTVETKTEDVGGEPLQEEKGISQIPINKVIVSVPSCLHSVKPPLQVVMKEYLPSNSHCLELFARNLTPDWTSWGNQVLKHQHMKYFEPVT